MSVVHEQAGAASLIFQALVLAMAVTVYLSNPFGQQGSLILFLFLTVSASVLPPPPSFAHVGGYVILPPPVQTKMYDAAPCSREARIYRKLL